MSNELNFLIKPTNVSIVNIPTNKHIYLDGFEVDSQVG